MPCKLHQFLKIFLFLIVLIEELLEKKWVFEKVYEFYIREDCFFSFNVPYFVIIDGILCLEFFWIIINFFLFRLKNCLKVKIPKEKVRILLLSVGIALSNIRVDNVSFTLIPFQNMITKPMDNITKVLRFFPCKHNPILCARQQINIFLQIPIINHCFIASIIDIICIVDYFRPLWYLIVEKCLLFKVIEPTEVVEQQGWGIQPYSSLLVQNKASYKIRQFRCLVPPFIFDFSE